ncbi:hypothetical protein M9H77_22969 [Catharanthus roseus]|uniref:Uncharacterized protein n=1 Tax=Catharanthus roseus TaxID=4058 RepID=A0ACC0AVZ6_CATRO|nr:hypothetical protein M9H77_22969 [Catharanthus roseus]
MRWNGITRRPLKIFQLRGGQELLALMSYVKVLAVLFPAGIVGMILDSEDQFLNWKPKPVTTVDRGRSTVHIMESYEIVHSEESSASPGKRARTSLAWDVFETLLIDSHGKRKEKCRGFERFESQYGTASNCDGENKDDEDEGISIDIQSWVARLYIDEDTS